MLEQQIERDLKTALLAGDGVRVSTLRMMKATLLNVKVATGQRESGLDDAEATMHLSKEAKKRQESAEMYIKAGDQERADQERAEKAIIQEYLPTQLSEQEIVAVVEQVMEETDANSAASMGQVIGLVKQKTNGAADGAMIARLVKERLNA
jgi:uncharacterized protein YqeY